MFVKKKQISDIPGKKPIKKWKKILWIVCISILVICASYAAYLYASGKRMFDPNNLASAPFFKKLSGQNYTLKGEGDGRINILLLGYGGSGHDGAYLTDSIEVVSIDPVNKKMAMLSIPRDLYVSMKNPNYSGRINAVYGLGKPVSPKSNYNGADLIKQKVGDILDLPIHYYASMDFSGFKKAIDAIGGIDLTVDNSFTDYSYPADKGDGYLSPQRFKAGPQHMDGTTSLIFARSRHAAGSEGSDFARSLRQQKVIAAFKEKLMSNGTLVNPKKMASLVNILSSSVKTDFQANELKELASLIKDVDTKNIATAVIDNSADGPLESFTGTDGASLLRPKAGTFDYSEIQKIAHQIFTDPNLKNENAKIEVVNGTRTSGLAAKLSETLKSYNYNIVSVINGKATAKTTIFDYSNGSKPITLEFLEKRLSVKAIKMTAPSTSSGIDISIQIGEDYKGFSKESATSSGKQN